MQDFHLFRPVGGQWFPSLLINLAWVNGTLHQTEIEGAKVRKQQ
jgi:hypothetical protein